MSSRLSQKSRPSCAGSKVPLVSTFPVASSSITSPGGTRPPGPTSVEAGSGLPLERTEIVSGDPSSVVVSPAVSALNSLTRPPTWTASPTATAAAAAPPKTKIASEVAGSASGLGSCRKKPFGRTAVTMPVVTTFCSTSGETCAAPWIAWIGVGVTGGETLNEEPTSAAIVSGGSSPSRSCTDAAATVKVQLSPGEKSAAGSSENVVGPPEAASGWAPLVAHAIAKAPGSTATGSLKTTLGLVPVATPVAPAGGVVETTVGAASPGGGPPQGAGAVPELRGVGAPAAKSAELTSVSTQPPPARRSAVDADGGGAGRSLREARRPVADEVDDLGSLGRVARRRIAVARKRRRAADERDLAGGRVQGRRPGRVRRGQRRPDRARHGSLADEQIAAGRDRRRRQRRGGEGAGPRRGRVLHRPSGDRARGRAAVEELDVVVRVDGAARRARAAAPAVDLADHDVGRGPVRGQRSGGTRDEQRAASTPSHRASRRFTNGRHTTRDMALPLGFPARDGRPAGRPPRPPHPPPCVPGSTRSRTHHRAVTPPVTTCTSSAGAGVDGDGR